MVIHYNNALRPELFSAPVCHPTGTGHKTTTDRAKVTCKNCLKRFDTKVRK